MPGATDATTFIRTTIAASSNGFARIALDEPTGPRSAPTDPFSGFENYRRPGWNGEGASPLSQRVIDKAKAIFEALRPALGSGWVTPGTVGSIGIYWHTRDARVQISIKSDRRV